jgi:hypothetical protein
VRHTVVAAKHDPVTHALDLEHIVPTLRRDFFQPELAGLLRRQPPPD